MTAKMTVFVPQKSLITNLTWKQISFPVFFTTKIYFRAFDIAKKQFEQFALLFYANCRIFRIFLPNSLFFPPSSVFFNML